MIDWERYTLRKLEFIKVMSLHQRYTEDVGRCEEPAAPRRSLICDRRPLERDLDIKYLLVFNVRRSACENSFGVCGGEGRQGQPIV